MARDMRATAEYGLFYVIYFVDFQMYVFRLLNEVGFQILQRFFCKCQALAR